jgi:hypothetical protein
MDFFFFFFFDSYAIQKCNRNNITHQELVHSSCTLHLYINVIKVIKYRFFSKIFDGNTMQLKGLD